MSLHSLAKSAVFIRHPSLQFAASWGARCPDYPELAGASVAKTLAKPSSGCAENAQVDV